MARGRRRTLATESILSYCYYIACYCQGRWPVVTTAAPPRTSRRRVRNQQRAAHLVAGAVLLAYIYLGPALGAGFTAAVQWAVAPVAVGSGIALWKWPRIRTLLRNRSRG